MHIEPQGLREVQDGLKQLKSKIDDTEPLLNELRNYLENVIEESFENEESPDGIKWSPIKPRKNDPHPEKILYAEGTLQGSLYGKVYKEQLTIGVNATAKGYQYPIALQFGNKKGTLPPRAFMPIKLDGTLYPNIEKELEEIISDYFNALGLE